MWTGTGSSLSLGPRRWPKHVPRPASRVSLPPPLAVREEVTICHKWGPWVSPGRFPLSLPSGPGSGLGCGRRRQVLTCGCGSGLVLRSCSWGLCVWLGSVGSRLGRPGRLGVNAPGALGQLSGLCRTVRVLPGLLLAGPRGRPRPPARPRGVPRDGGDSWVLGQAGPEAKQTHWSPGESPRANRKQPMGLAVTELPLLVLWCVWTASVPAPGALLAFEVLSGNWLCSGPRQASRPSPRGSSLRELA